VKRSPSLACALLLVLAGLGSALAPANAADGGDTDPPSEVPDLILDTPHVNADDRRYVTQAPSWSWGEATDESGIDHYEITQHQPDGSTIEATRAPDDRSYTAQDPLQGEICLEVTAVDGAGNVGPATDPRCAFLDDRPPVSAFTQPSANVLQLADGETRAIDPPESARADASYALGDVVVYLNSSDPGDRMAGLGDAQILEDDRQDTEPRGCDNRLGQPYPDVCRWVDTEQATQDPSRRDLFAVVSDDAGNSAEQPVANYTKVDVAAVERPDRAQVGTAGVVHWEPSTSASFDRYEVYGVLAEGEPVAQPVRSVATVEDREQVAALDPEPVPGETWRYVVVAFEMGAAGQPVVSGVTHATELAYTGDDGQASRPSSCGLVSCR
jgi:hypothetical protein